MHLVSPYLGIFISSELRFKNIFLINCKKKLLGKLEEDCIFVQDICKSYGNLAAVNHLSFGVHHGECFGLLGVNGAGKTTAFRIITGDEVPSFGRAFGFRGSSERNPTKFFSNIGYCPQFDPILAVLTGKEMLMVCNRRSLGRKYHIPAKRLIPKRSAIVIPHRYEARTTRRTSCLVQSIY